VADIAFWKLKNGETNVIPPNAWPFGDLVARPIRITMKTLPYSYAWESCYDDWAADDQGCDWYREHYHRKMAWQITAIARGLIKARKEIPNVGDFDKAPRVSLTTYYGEYIAPLCAQMNAFNEYIQMSHLRARFNYAHGAKDCGGPGTRCVNGYYPIQYWEDLDMAACIELQDILNTLENHLIDLQITTGASKTPEQIWLALKNAKQKDDIYLGKKQQWITNYANLGGDTKWTPKDLPVGYAGTGGPSEEKSLMDQLLEKELLKADSIPPKMSPLILLGAGALVVVLLATKKKKG
jgi:hypothetical protein